MFLLFLMAVHTIQLVASEKFLKKIQDNYFPIFAKRTYYLSETFKEHEFIDIKKVIQCLQKESWLNTLLKNKDTIQAVNIQQHTFQCAHYKPTVVNKNGSIMTNMEIKSLEDITNLQRLKAEAICIIFNESPYEILGGNDFKTKHKAIFQKLDKTLAALIYAFSFTMDYYFQNPKTDNETLKKTFEDYFVVCKQIKKSTLPSTNSCYFFYRYLSGKESKRIKLVPPQDLASDYNRFLAEQRSHQLRLISDHAKSFFLAVYCFPFFACILTTLLYTNPFCSFLIKPSSLLSWLLLTSSSFVLCDLENINPLRTQKYLQWNKEEKKFKKRFFFESFTKWEKRGPNPNKDGGEDSFHSEYIVNLWVFSPEEIIQWIGLWFVSFYALNYGYRCYTVLQKHKNEI